MHWLPPVSLSIHLRSVFEPWSRFWRIEGSVMLGYWKSMSSATLSSLRVSFTGLSNLKLNKRSDALDCFSFTLDCWRVQQCCIDSVKNVSTVQHRRFVIRYDNEWCSQFNDTSFQAQIRIGMAWVGSSFHITEHIYTIKLINKKVRLSFLKANICAQKKMQVVLAAVTWPTYACNLQ